MKTLASKVSDCRSGGHRVELFDNLQRNAGVHVNADQPSPIARDISRYCNRIGAVVCQCQADCVVSVCPTRADWRRAKKPPDRKESGGKQLALGE